MVIYRSACFKGYATLFGSESRGGIFVELEQANGHTVFLARQGLVQFCPHGMEITAEFLRGKDSDGH